MRWTGPCYRCHREREIESRPDHAMQALCDDCAAKPHTPPTATPELAPRQRKRASRRLAALPMLGLPFAPVHWLWRQYVPLGKITVLAGLAGQGKSQLTCLLAGLASRGWADAPAGDVLIVSGEDDPKDTIGPRLAAAGADSKRLFVLDAREVQEDGTAIPTTLSMPEDAKGLREALNQLASPRLLVLDPVTAFLSMATDAHKNADVRRALVPLKALAEDFGLAVLLVTHLNKSSALEPLLRVADSGAFTALARGVLLMAADPDDEQGDRGHLKVLAVAKSNLADTGEHSLRFRITPTNATDDHGTTVNVVALEPLGRSPLSAHDLLTPQQDRPALDEARIFVRGELEDGWRKASEIKKAARDYGITEMTLRRARELECQRPRQLDRAWWWALRGVPWDANGDESSRARAREARAPEHLEHLSASDDPDDRGSWPPARANTWNGETEHLRQRDAILGEPWRDDE